MRLDIPILPITFVPHDQPPVRERFRWAYLIREHLAGLDSAATAHQEPSTYNPHSGFELRISKLCSRTRPESSSTNAPDPTRHKLCNVRARNTLPELFNIDDDRKEVPRKFHVELRYGDKDDDGDKARVLDLDANADSKFKMGEGRDLKEIAGKMKKVEQKGEAKVAEAEDEEG
ncbi:hypothetical protein D8674_037519 [Pyrus ussuriensis x Pyrus communis]|uniref:Uncharacterized protein n=1 Tax=Pyrus ussuriensis x Pyrus communis TaxID=2448454 RepID=A0A5N5GG43_9ROSA|nr:hypothetical protein D8674_037519 [Pyrus ussuriensis x Pyrus communis]